MLHRGNITITGLEDIHQQPIQRQAGKRQRMDDQA